MLYNYLTLNIFCELGCFIISIICLKKDKSKVWKSIIYFMLLTCITEVIGLTITLKYHIPNHWLYNIFLIFEAVFTSVIFANLLNTYINSKAIIGAGLTILFSIYMFEIILHGIYQFNTLTTSVMSVLFVFYSFIYYYFISRDELYINLKTNAGFWWVAGALFFYFGSTVCNVFFYELSQVKITVTHRLSYFIFKGLNVLLYGLWSYSFLCRRFKTT